MPVHLLLERRPTLPETLLLIMAPLRCLLLLLLIRVGVMGVVLLLLRRWALRVHGLVGVVILQRVVHGEHGEGVLWH